MGTSTSSAGAGAGSPFDPPWLNDAVDGIDSSQSGNSLEPSEGEGADQTDAADNDTGSQSEEQSSDTAAGGNAPPGRYKEARGQLSRFIGSGDSGRIGRALGSFVNKGLGGPARAASRMRTSAAAAAALGGFFAAVRDSSDPAINDWVRTAKERGLSAQDVALEVIQKLTPAGGSIDEESAKQAMNQAIIHLYEVDPDADIFSLSDEQISSLMGYTLAFDIYNRVQLELGRVFEKLKFSAQLIHERLGQVQDYILVVVRDAMDKVRGGKSAKSVSEISTLALRSTLEVFGTQ